jgi:CheY-like chemotaxis protein
MDGTIRFDGRKGRDPSPAGDPEPAGAEGEAVGFHLPHVLLVEDNVTNRFVFAHFLRRIGVPFHMVENGAEALAAWEAGAYDVVLMDIDMPVMDGYETARELRRREVRLGRASTTIVALTADAMLECRERARSCGMDDFITKPVDLERLRKSIWNALRPAMRSGGSDATIGRLSA